VSCRPLVIGLLACALGACALMRGKEETAAAPPPAVGYERGERLLAQLDFGPRARFAECLPPGCPSRTPKTIATSVAQATPQPVAAPGAPSDAEPPRQPPPVAAASAPVPVKVADQRLTLLFALGSSALTGEHKARLRSVLRDLQRSERIVVAGRTDDLGSEALNQSLALARGLAVRDYLLDIDPQLPARIGIDARGRCCYAVPNDSAPARASNRRVEVAYTRAFGVAP
jgi:outer membrane protein OmpA-like peptidoglycan-associated protein